MGDYDLSETKTGAKGRSGWEPVGDSFNSSLQHFFQEADLRFFRGIGPRFEEIVLQTEAAKRQYQLTRLTVGLTLRK